MAFKIMVENTLYTTGKYDDDGIFISFIDKYDKMVKLNKNHIKYIKEC